MFFICISKMQINAKSARFRSIYISQNLRANFYISQNLRANFYISQNLRAKNKYQKTSKKAKKSQESEHFSPKIRNQFDF